MPPCLLAFLEILVMTLWVWQPRSLPGKGCAVPCRRVGCSASVGGFALAHSSCPTPQFPPLSNPARDHPSPGCLWMDGNGLWEGWGQKPIMPLGWRCS